MDLEVDDLYCNLNKLLNDICIFLSDETTLEKLSPFVRKQADELINRSKTQLQAIAKVSSNSEYDGAYVDMERKPSENEDNYKADEDDDDVNNIYSSVDEPEVNSTHTETILQCPFLDLPGKDLSKDIKYGPLQWKTKFIITRMRKVYGGIHKNWLLLYLNEKDPKPIQTLDLKCHRAMAMPSKPNKNCPQDFNVVCTNDEKKIYYFIALTHKDMLQWASHINRIHAALIKNNKNNEEDNTESTIVNTNYIKDHEDGDEEEEDIYNDIEMAIANITTRRELEKPPALPKRPFASKTNVPLPPLPPSSREKENVTRDSNSSVVSYDPVDSSLSQSLSNKSFSSDDEEDIYEPFVLPMKKDSPPPKQSEINIDVPPPIPTSPKPAFKPKPKPKPKMFTSK